MNYINKFSNIYLNWLKTISTRNSIRVVLQTIDTLKSF